MGSSSFASLAHDLGDTQRAISQDSSGRILHVAEFAMGQVSTGFLATGNAGTPRAYQAIGGVYLVDLTVLQRTPMIFGLDQRSGPKSGGDRVTLYGAFLNSPAGQDPAIWIQGTRATQLNILDDARIALTIPQGIELSSGNPLGSASLIYASRPLTSPPVVSTLLEAYTYLPALRGPQTVPIGSAFWMALEDVSAPRFMALWVGVSSVQFAVPPLGSVAIFPLIPVFTAAAPSGRQALQLVVPADPNLVAYQVLFQGVSLDPSAMALQGSFTNVLTVGFTP
ncbi:MAG: hypothetical protein IPN34_19045 [Planctomycetes bacterium]|nr:hypothetical protein [Planctomycetota bacterium]